MTRQRKPPRLEPGVVSLLVAILTDRPNLPHAVCRGRHQPFDRALHPDPGTDDDDARLTAAQLCRLCPHTTSCPDSLATRKAVA